MITGSVGVVMAEWSTISAIECRFRGAGRALPPTLRKPKFDSEIWVENANHPQSIIEIFWYVLNVFSTQCEFEAGEVETTDYGYGVTDASVQSHNNFQFPGIFHKQLKMCANDFQFLMKRPGMQYLG